ncbi:MAG TPA: hypothetical protein VNH83_28260 [Bryobacteraceae bacterium]|nr:hypothetical protein [Bryobacteraceae bacterium]
MNVIAIDPGTTESGVVAWDGTKILDAKFLLNEDVLTYLNAVCDPDVVLVIEEFVCYGMAIGKESIKTIFWSGRFWQAYDFHRVLMERKTVKLHLCETSRATDSNIRQALIDRFGDPGRKSAPGLLYPLKGHTWAAFALAVTWMDKNGGVK